MDKHSLSRTSPKRGPFIGVCMKCGATGLTLADMSKRCANPANLTADETLAVAIRGFDQ